ncbi:ABC transporter substrate-binding protein [Dactylosporangium sp. NPDC006015]|uniref:ABC transporter substrate-binding protein n=1 Tax=Dactylosporangium sp. NPDC006015 TaxID=3154576 RepID=UPI0033B4C447
MRKFLTTILAVGLSAGLAACSTAERPTAPNTEGPLAKVRIGVGGINKVIYLPAMLTERLGYFAAEGLEVELSDEQNGVNQENEMLAGHLDGVVGFMDHAYTLQLKGKCVRSVVQFANTPLEKVMLSSKDAATVKTMADLKGKKVGFTSKGSSTNALINSLMAKAGVKEGDFVGVAAGAGSTFVAAIENGGINAGMTTPPTSTTLLSKGTATTLVDLSTVDSTRKALGGLYPASSLYMPCDWVAAHPRESQKLANAFVKTLRYIGSSSAEDIAAKMPADYAGGNPQLYAASIKETKDGFTTDGVIDPDGARNVIEVLAAGIPEVASGKASIDVAKGYTTEFVTKVPKA